MLHELEHRAEQVRQLKPYEGKRLGIPTTIAAFAALFAAGGVGGGLIVKILGG